MSFLKQIQEGVGRLLGQDVSNLSEAELAQVMEDAANATPAPAVVEATPAAPVVEEIPTQSTETSNETILDLTSRITELESSVQNLSSLVSVQATEISNLVASVKTLNNLNSVLTNKVVALNVASTTPVKETDNPVDAVTKTISEADEKVVDMNMSDFILGKTNSK